MTAHSQAFPYSSVVIVGGGTAGWMTAVWLRHHLPNAVPIKLVESSTIGTVGVGEGTTPHLKQFFSVLGIAEQEWMPTCGATYKNGITFKNWGGTGRPEQYFHPFPSASDRYSAGLFMQAVEAARNGTAELPFHPDPYFLSWHLTHHQQSPIQQSEGAPIPLSYAYHFDAGLLGRFLRSWAEKRGVERIEGNVCGVLKHPSGDISAIKLQESESPIQADFFIDCSGFHGLLGEKALGIKYLSYADSLLNDAAVTLPSLTTSPLSVHTLAQAMDSGWRWQIPLQHRTGNGYVYASTFTDTDKAAQALRDSLGVSAIADEPRHLRLKVGRLTQTWANNCLCVGLSQGFIEPLEATALHLVQSTLNEFVAANAHYDSTDAAREHVNRAIGDRFDGIKDYIVAHYVVSARDDTPYWCAAREVKQSDNLRALLACWRAGGNIIAEIEKRHMGQYYHPISWYCLLVGYGELGETATRIAAPTWETLQTKLTQWRQRFLPHQQALTSGPNKSTL